MRTTRQLLVASEYGEPANYVDTILSRLSQHRGPIALLLITKKPTDSMDIPRYSLSHYIPTMCHFTITGLGGTKVEPHIPTPKESTEQALSVIEELHINPGSVTLRIDPIVPELIHIQRESWPETLEAFASIGVRDVRCSIVDYYLHARERWEKLGIKVNPCFQASEAQIFSSIDSLSYLVIQFGMRLHLCAEKITRPEVTEENIDTEGCASAESWRRLGMDDFKPLVRRQREECTCNLRKKDLLAGLEKGCSPGGCAYCYWR